MPELMRVEDRLLKIVQEAADSNMPMNLGIPAITIGRSGLDKGGRVHSLDEWIDVEKEPMAKAIATSLSIVLTATGME